MKINVQDPNFVAGYAAGYEAGRKDEREANGKVLSALAFMKERDRLLAENARLREALEELLVAHRPRGNDIEGMKAAVNARAALADDSK